MHFLIFWGFLVLLSTILQAFGEAFRRMGVGVGAQPEDAPVVGDRWRVEACLRHHRHARRVDATTVGVARLDLHVEQEAPLGVEVAGQPHVILPYAFDTNDMRFSLPQGFAQAEDFFTYLRDSFDALYAEGAERPKMMSVGMHCRLLGRPGRMVALQRFLDHIAKHDRVWVCRRVDIARHWKQVHPFQSTN